MRYLILSAFLLLGLSSLQAATFLERFNSLEQDIQNVQDEVDALKKGGATTSSSDAANTKALEAEISKLKKSQEALEAKVSKLKNQPQTKGSGNAVANEDLKALQTAIKKLKTQQRSMHKQMKALEGRSVASGSGASRATDSDVDMDEIQEQFDEISKTLSEVRKFTNGNHMKITADFRSSVDSLQYTMADRSKHSNDAVLSNRLWVNMKYKATQKISFTGQLAYNKTYGARSGNSSSFAGYDQFDWVVNEKATSDDTLRVKKAYFFYANDTFAGLKMPWTFSIGRRPSTNGHLAHFRDDDEPSSPMAHSINVEFDGFSSKFDFSNYTGINGQYIKFCLGRGGTNAAGALTGTPYASGSGVKDIDLAGAIISLYNNGHYSLTTQTYHAKNLIDVNGTTNPAFENVGDLSSFSANFVAEGIGEEGSDFLWSKWLGQFLDNTVFFVSYAASVSHPYDNGTSTMFGSSDDKKGESVWVGLNMPTLSQKGKWGLEYNHGTKYWRAITYAEDTLIGSKVAARGDAYEIYWTEPFANDTMSWQLRFTYIDYKYTGSNGFFGGNATGTTGTGTPFTMEQAVGGGNGANVVDAASDLRFYLRYRY